MMMHCLLWIADVPQYGVNDTSEVTQYIDQIITCQRSWGEPEIDSLVERPTARTYQDLQETAEKDNSMQIWFPKVSHATD